MNLFGLVCLPPFSQRTLIHLWQFADPPAPVLRSIEMVDGRYYMVARLLDEHGAVRGGEQGLLLRRVSFDEYHQTIGVDSRYKISETGELHCYSSGETVPSVRCVPVKAEQFNLGD